VRAAIAVWLAAVALAGAAGAGSAGCALFEDRVDRSCKTSNDCFRAQGEVCDPDKHVCVAGPDAAPLRADPMAPDQAGPAGSPGELR
jgi:hypothetical protein